MDVDVCEGTCADAPGSTDRCDEGCSTQLQLLPAATGAEQTLALSTSAPHASFDMDDMDLAIDVTDIIGEMAGPSPMKKCRTDEDGAEGVLEDEDESRPFQRLRQAADRVQSAVDSRLSVMCNPFVTPINALSNLVLDPEVRVTGNRFGRPTLVLLGLTRSAQAPLATFATAGPMPLQRVALPSEWMACMVQEDGVTQGLCRESAQHVRFPDSQQQQPSGESVNLFEGGALAMLRRRLEFPADLNLPFVVLTLVQPCA